jgi:hypothetical protein
VRNSIGHSKLRNVALLVIEKERALAPNNDKIVDRSAAAHKSRRISYTILVAGISVAEIKARFTLDRLCAVRCARDLHIFN